MDRLTKAMDKYSSEAKKNVLNLVSLLSNGSI